MVLLRVKAIAIYREETAENPNKIPKMNPTREVKIICPTPVIRETFPTSLITPGLKLNPTMNNSKAMPIWEKIEIASVDFIMFKK